ncbi:class D sortase [Laceyella putida]|uniref:Class D sortase n=1 Tax=Laceyella putida TaxID=110101 RepID=A0ABW2RG44_9BACL
MARKVAWLFMIAGALILGYNAFNWWNEISIAVVDPKLAMSFSDDWNDTSKQPALLRGQKDTSAQVPNGTKVGELVIPKMGAILPIVQGTDEESLKKGVGLYEGYGTVNPGETGHVVLSGHRDTVFRGLGDLKAGDKLLVRYNGNIFTYQFRKYWITKASDRTVIVPIPRPVLTLTTCYPFDYIGDAPDRYIIRAELIDIKKDPKNQPFTEVAD